MTKDEFRAKWEPMLMGTVLDGYTSDAVGGAEKWLRVKLARKRLWESLDVMYEDLKQPIKVNNGQPTAAPAAVRK